MPNDNRPDGDRHGDDRQGDARPGDDQHERSGSPLRAVVGLGLILVLILGVLFVMQQLRHASAIQDCVASGRTNCAPIGTGR